MRRAAALLAALFALQCKQSPSDEKHTAGSAPHAAAPAPSAAAPSAPKHWYEGRWAGTYEAALQRIELEVGGVRAWKEDDGKAASGPGTLTVSVTPEGIATGESDGPLGPLHVSGTADAERLRLTLSPRGDAPNGFRGTLVAEGKDGLAKGALSASSGDSLTVRKGTVELRKAPAPP